jgi:hypothetical protein
MLPAWPERPLLVADLDAHDQAGTDIYGRAPGEVLDKGVELQAGRLLGLAVGGQAHGGKKDASLRAGT